MLTLPMPPHRPAPTPPHFAARPWMPFHLQPCYYPVQFISTNLLAPKQFLPVSSLSEKIEFYK